MPSMFSPHAWGWTGHGTTNFDDSTVLPTRVGVDRQDAGVAVRDVRSPHTRGGGPMFSRIPFTMLLFSPHAWGWTDQQLPFHSGHRRSPHTRGGGPVAALVAATEEQFSPHAWGWTVRPTHKGRATGVLPTRVGVDRCASSFPSVRHSSPHTRGGGPRHQRHRRRNAAFSPHAWGWTVPRDRSVQVLRSPHTRGGGPFVKLTSHVALQFSPHAWGWTAFPATAEYFTRVLPTRVGVDRS